MNPLIRFPIPVLRLVALVAALVLAGPALGAHVASLSGTVETRRAEPSDWQAARAGAPLAPGERVRTGDDGRAELVLGRATIRLYPNSLLRVPAPAAGADGDAVQLEEGTSLFEVMRGQRPFEVRTPEVVVSVKGTRFSVSLAGAGASVAVFRGSVGVKNLALEAARETLVREGFVASGSESFDLRVLDLADPWDAFGAEVLPDLPLPDVDPTRANRAALEAARSAALETARPEAVVRAAQRHVPVRARVESLRKAREVAGKLDPPSVEPDGGTRVPRVPQPDVVADAPAALADALKEHFVETWINGGQPDPSVPGAGPFTLTHIPNSTGAGLGEILVEEASGQSWTFDQTAILAVIDGSQPLPAPLVTELVSQGVTDPVLFAEKMMTILGN